MPAQISASSSPLRHIKALKPLPGLPHWLWHPPGQFASPLLRSAMMQEQMLHRDLFHQATRHKTSQPARVQPPSPEWHLTRAYRSASTPPAKRKVTTPVLCLPHHPGQFIGIPLRLTAMQTRGLCHNRLFPPSTERRPLQRLRAQRRSPKAHLAPTCLSGGAPQPKLPKPTLRLLCLPHLVRHLPGLVISMSLQPVVTQAQGQTPSQPVRAKPQSFKVADPVSTRPSPSASTQTQLKAAKAPVHSPRHNGALPRLLSRSLPSGHRREGGLPLPKARSLRADSAHRNTAGERLFHRPRRDSRCSLRRRLSSGAALRRRRSPRRIKVRDYASWMRAPGEVRCIPSFLSVPAHRALEAAAMERMASTCSAKTTMRERVGASSFPSRAREIIRLGSISEPLFISSVCECDSALQRTAQSGTCSFYEPTYTVLLWF